MYGRNAGIFFASAAAIHAFIGRMQLLLDAFLLVMTGILSMGNINRETGTGGTRK